MERLFSIISLSIIMLGYNNCAYVKADIPDHITVSVEMKELNVLAGRCFDENLTRQDFLQCLENDLEQAGLITTLQ